MKNNRANRHNDRGFTLSEVLLTVAILVVLFALAAVPVSKMRRELRQTELDSKAEILFQTAQNRMTQLLAAGMEEKYKSGGDVKRFTYIPLDAEEDKYDETDVGRLPLWYVTDAEKDNASAAAYYILPREQTDAELREGHWLVEYNADSGSVYAVFYSEEALGVHTGLDVLRYRSQRVKTAKVGYYGGDAAAVNDTGVLAPRAEILNGETLEVRITCKAPNDRPLHFFITIRDDKGNETARTELKNDTKTFTTIEKSFRDYEVTVTLDDLSGDGSRRFAQQEWLKMLTPGENLTVTVEVTSDDPLVEGARFVPEKTNGLFHTLRGGDTAVVTCARHLQNLDETSKLAPVITRAVQEKNIDFTGASGWASVYGEKKFRPIVNTALREYRGSYIVDGTTYRPVIAHLPVDTNGDAGLFESFSGGTLADITLTGAQIRGTGRVGGLAGTLSGTVSVTGCRVYLDPASDGLSTKTERDIRSGLTGTTTNFKDRQVLHWQHLPVPLRTFRDVHIPNHANIRVMDFHRLAGVFGPLHILLMHHDFLNKQPQQLRRQLLNVCVAFGPGNEVVCAGHRGLQFGDLPLLLRDGSFQLLLLRHITGGEGLELLRGDAAQYAVLIQSLEDGLQFRLALFHP